MIDAQPDYLKRTITYRSYRRRLVTTCIFVYDIIQEKRLFMHFTLPRDLFEELVQKIGKEEAQKFANTLEKFLDFVYQKSSEEIQQKKEQIKAELYNELRNELATKEFVRAEINEVRAEINEVRAEINEVRAEIKQNNLLLKVLIALALFGLTIFNPNFVTLIEKIFH